MDHMIKSSDYFDFEMDLYWFAHPGEDPVAWLKKYPNEFKLMHLRIAECEKGIEGNQTGESDVETNCNAWYRPDRYRRRGQGGPKIGDGVFVHRG